MLARICGTMWSQLWTSRSKGEGDDTVYVDEIDVVNADCENVFEAVEQV
jgi:hypothetical protein